MNALPEKLTSQQMNAREEFSPKDQQAFHIVCIGFHSKYFRHNVDIPKMDRGWDARLS